MDIQCVKNVTLILRHSLPEQLAEESREELTNPVSPAKWQLICRWWRCMSGEL